MSSIVNKIKEVINDHKHSDPEGTHGPHSNRVANAADPRVDSDRDGSHTVGSTTGATGQYSSSDNYTYGSSGNQFANDGPAPNTAGPHQRDVLNKADPRVDSDRDGSRTVGGSTTGTTGYTGTTGTTGYSSTTGTTGYPSTTGTTGTNFDGARGGDTFGTTGAGTTGTTGTFNSLPEGTVGPHGSRLANAADPRVDSDLDGSRTVGGNTYGTTGTTGNTYGTAGNTYGTTGNTYDTTGNTYDTTGNTYDTTRNTYNTTGNTYGTTGTTGFDSGPAPNTQGPHRSDMLNKIDPRVDSDFDGSRTLGSSNNQGNLGTGAMNTGTQNTTGQYDPMGRSYGTGPAPTTAGPYGNEYSNRADLDGSRTMGGNQTFSQS